MYPKVESMYQLVWSEGKMTEQLPTLQQIRQQVQGVMVNIVITINKLFIMIITVNTLATLNIMVYTVNTLAKLYTMVNTVNTLAHWFIMVNTVSKLAKL